MIGINGYGVYIPRNRLSRDAMADVWGGRSAGGEIAVANYDEDSATMAVEAALNCMGDTDPSSVDALFFASTTAPYLEKQTASLIAAVADLPRNARTNDFGNSLRCGTQALLAALDAAQSKSARNVIVAAGECRMAEPDSDEEQFYGNAGAALMVGPDPVALIDAALSITDEMHEHWRTGDEKFVKKFSAPFATKIGYRRVMEEAIHGILERTELKPADFKKIAVRTPDPRSAMGMIQKAGFDLKTQVVESLWRNAGDTGTVQPIVQIAAFLEKAEPGDKLLLVSYGDGADAMVITATDKVKEVKPKKDINYFIENKIMLPGYGKYMRLKKLTVSEEVDTEDSSAIVLWREGKQNLAFYGVKCQSCGAIQFPRQRVCINCGAKDQFDDFKMQRQGRVYTFTNDFLVPAPDPPVTQTIVDFDDGSRVYCRMTDNDPDQVKVDMPVEMCFRVLHRGGGFNNYFWKCRPY